MMSRRWCLGSILPVFATGLLLLWAPSEGALPDYRDGGARPADAQHRATGHAGALFDYRGRMGVNNLDLFVTNLGSFGCDLTAGKPGLIFPRGSGRAVLFAAGIWMGAEVNGELRTCIAEYSQEYVPGPMLEGTYLPDQPRFRNYRINRGDDATTNPDYASWPVMDGAPVDGLGRPLLFGDATIWSVYNDADPDHHRNWTAGMTAPLGVEIQQTTYAYSRTGALGNMVFLNFRIVNKGGSRLDDAYVALWADPDLGESSDDLVGCDTTLSLGYCYNGHDIDDVYGSAPPALGLALLRGPVLRGSGGVPTDTLGMTSFAMYTNGTDPQIQFEAYNLMKGLRKNGSPMHVQDNPTQPVTTYRFPGDPVTGSGWLDTGPEDRRMLVTAGPFVMRPGDSQDVVCAVIVGQGSDRFSSIVDLRAKAMLAPLGVVPLPEERTAAVDYDPDVINLASRGPWLTAYVEPSGFDPSSIVLSSVHLAGSVPPDSRFAAVGDRDGDGAPEIMLRFGRAGLDPLLVPGANALQVTGTLRTGERFHGTGSLRVIDPSAGRPTGSVAPNPLNPAGVLTFRTTKPGPAGVELFDVAGRLVRRISDVPNLPAGWHHCAIDGRDDGGAPLATGVYFYRVRTADSAVTGRVAIVK